MTLGCEHKIRQAFSRSAQRYENFAGMQREIGQRLLEDVKKRGEFKTIIDIGMGTGYLTQQLKGAFPRAVVAGMDVARGMVDYARRHYPGLEILLADAARIPFKENIFDLAVSNLAFQWVGDLRSAFKGTWNCLKPGGFFYLSMFTRRSLEELFTSLEATRTGDNASVPVEWTRLVESGEVLRAAKDGGFAILESKTIIRESAFPDMFALLRWLKGIGANTGRTRYFVGRRLLAGARDYYQRCFTKGGNIIATFEVLTLAGVKK